MDAFATVDDLKARWADFPPGAEKTAEILLEDASQFIRDMCPQWERAPHQTRRRIVCAVVRRAMPSSGMDVGFSSIQQSAGPFQATYTPVNPGGDFYLTKAEKQALGCGRVRAFGVDVASVQGGGHLPWCSIMFAAKYCSCGFDIAGEPIFEGGENARLS